MMRTEKYKSVPTTMEEGMGCRWCEWYRNKCSQCTCVIMASMSCPCRETKDLRKVWYSSDPTTIHFERETSILVENTPKLPL